MVTLVVKTTIVAAGNADAAIATALNDGATYTNVYGVGVMPMSNTQWKVMVVYS